MDKPSELELQPFFLVVDTETGEILCAHQEYSASDRRLLTRCRDEEHILAIAMKANLRCKDMKNRLRVSFLMCSPITNFSRYVVEFETGQLIERKTSGKTPEPQAIAVDFIKRKSKAAR